MIAQELQPPLLEFESDLRRAEELLSLIKEYRTFATSLPPSEPDVWLAARDLHATAAIVRTDLPVLSGSILLYVCGRFEYFVRELVAALADDLAARCTAYEDLPELVREELQSRSLEVALHPRKFGFEPAEAEQILVIHAANLQPAKDREGPVRIASRVLAITESNMNPRTMADIFKRVQLKDVWATLGKQAPLKARLGKASDRDCTAEATSRLEKIMKDRNSVAHPTGSFSFPDVDQVLEFVSFMRTLATVLVDVAQIPLE